MRNYPLGMFLLVSLTIPVSLAAQSAQTITTSGPQSSQVVSLLQQSITAQTGGSSVTDVTMTGTVTITPPAPKATPESGTFTLIATSGGKSQATYNLPSGTRTGVLDISGTVPKLTVTGPDGVAHQITTQSALSPHPAWFFPPFLLSSGLSSSGRYTSSYVGAETKNGASVEHVSIWFLPGNVTPDASGLWKQWTQHDVYLDPTSSLPVAIDFNTHVFDQNHPDRTLGHSQNIAADLKSEARFSGYQQIDGHIVATHIQLYYNNQLVYDLAISSVNFNTGATIAD